MAEKLEYKGDQEFKPYMSYEVRMAYQAGYAQWKEWPCEGETLHAGIGWFHPFGKSHYYAILGDCEEKKAFPIDKYFTEDWMEIYDTSLFCIYRLEDGDIYAYDGIFCSGQRDENPMTQHLYAGHPLQRYCGRNRQIRGRRGWMGTAEGSGEVRSIHNLSLPRAVKCLTGYIKIQIRD